MVSGRAADRATSYGLPLSSASSCASSSACFSTRSASLFIKTPRCEALILRHGPLSNAARAAATALSTSAASDSATWVMTSLVDGFIVGKVFPDTLSNHFPLINSFVGPILTFDSITAVAVAILNTSSLRTARTGLGSFWRVCVMTKCVQGTTPRAPPDTNVSPEQKGIPLRAPRQDGLQCTVRDPPGTARTDRRRIHPAPVHGFLLPAGAQTRCVQPRL